MTTHVSKKKSHVTNPIENPSMSSSSPKKSAKPKSSSKTKGKTMTTAHAAHAPKKTNAHTTETKEVMLTTTVQPSNTISAQPTTLESEAPMTQTNATSPAPVATPSASSSTPVAAPVTPPATTATTPSLAYIQPPPAVSIPPIPEGFVPLSSLQFRGQLPRKEELAVMPGVVSEMTRFTDYAAVFGRTAPSHAAADQTLSAAYQWSALRAKLTGWEVYCQTQEALAWVQARALMEKLGPAFALAAASDGSLGTNYPSLVRLFGTPKAIAKRGVAVRAANKAEIAAGRAPFKGAAGKRRKTAAAKAALAAEELGQSAGSSGTSASPASPGAAPSPVVVAPVAPAQAIVASAPATPAPAAATAPATPAPASVPAAAINTLGVGHA